MNYSDSARIKAVLTNSGHSYVDSIDAADVVIFDTCSVRQKSEDKVTGKLKEIPTDKKVRLTGCMIQHNFRNKKIANETLNKKIDWLMERGNFLGNAVTNNPEIIGFNNDEFNKLEARSQQLEAWNIVYINHAYNPMFEKLTQKRKNIELFFRIDDTGFLPLMMKKLGYDVSPDAEVTNEYTRIIPKWANQSMDPNAKTVHVPISKWCSQFCAFCIVPYARWLEKHLPIDQVVAEARHHIENGAEEIVLLWQIVNKHPDFVEICKQILTIPWLKRLRYTSPYPTYYSDELLALHENEPKMCPHIHMPLQSGSNTILKKMFRGYTAEQFKEFVDKIRNLNRKISITTDIIVGFCDETEEDFQASLDLVQYARFDMIYIGKYSTRKGTFAQRKYIDNVDPAFKQERRTRLNDLLIQISRENNIQEVWTQRLIMINKIEKDRFSGYTDNMKTVIIKNPVIARNEWNEWRGNPGNREIGSFLNVNITDSDAFKLFAQPQT
jgi:tRNA-2-methylthio-N6-dimethylallyladenosine synthase